jgi:hypothetical protein
MFTRRDYGRSIRKFIVKHSEILHLVYFGDFQVFGDVTVFPFIFILGKKNIKSNNKTSIVSVNRLNHLTHVDVKESLSKELSDSVSEKYLIPSKNLTEDAWNISNEELSGLTKKLQNHISVKRLDEITEYVFVGIQSGKDEVFFVNENTLLQYKLEKEIVLPIYRGRDISRYFSSWTGTFIIYPYDKLTNQVISEKILKEKYPYTYHYLLENKNKLKGRDYFDKSGKNWYELWCERDFQKFKQIKIINAEISSENRFYLDEEGFLGNTKTFNTVLRQTYSKDYHYILGLLNSKVLEFFHKQTSVPKAGGFFEYKTQFLNPYPIYIINYQQDSEVETYKKITELVKRMIENKTLMKKVKVDNEKDYLQKKCSIIDRQIDQLVYELYGLNEEEIKIIESSNHK